MITTGKLKGIKVVVAAEGGKVALYIHGHSGEEIVGSLTKAFGPVTAAETKPAPKRRGRKPKVAAEAAVAA